MLILVDSRERENAHITKEFDKSGVEWRVQKLDYCDYSFIHKGISYETKCAIERKSGLNEISQNITKHSKRFIAEFERAKGCKVHLMIEECSFDDLMAHNYRSKLSPKDFESRLKTWTNHFQITLHFIQKNQAAELILNTFQNFLKEDHV